MDYDILPFESQCFLSDLEWSAIIESGTYIKTGNVYHTIFKKEVITFKMNEIGMCELLNRRKIPCKKYKLPIIDKNLSFSARKSVYLERENLQKGRELDDSNFLKYEQKAC